MRRAYYVFVYYFSWLVFGLAGLALNLGCALLLLLPRRKSYGPAVRRAIRALFDFWPRWLYCCGVVRVSWHGFDAPLTPGTVYIANHPTLIDATCLLARMPDGVCIFKPQLMRNPVLGPAAIMADYIAGDAGVDLIREAAARVAAGRSLLIFPEGTRTAPGAILGPLKAGFALIAGRAHAPVQLIVIRATPGLVARGQPWWKLPATLPAHVRLTLDQRWSYDAHVHAADLKDAVERRLHEVLAS
jgi:1-acyl-sn-glycerol-3-phosphate acyltransferase